MEIQITKIATQIKWYMLNYPLTSNSYWSLLDNSNNIIAEGNLVIPDDVINNWGVDDNVIENYIIGNITKELTK